MRLASIALLSLLAALPALAQDAPVFTGTGATEADACAAAKADAQAWVRAGKAEGRRRQLLKSGDCACTPSDGQLVCRLDAQVRDEAYEEEEER